MFNFRDVLPHSCSIYNNDGYEVSEFLKIVIYQDGSNLETASGV
jgi:hypothetical protein